MDEPSCNEPTKDTKKDICDIHSNTFCDQTLSLGHDECKQHCMLDKNCKSGYHNGNDIHPMCFVTNKQTFDIFIHDPTYGLIFHRNSSQYCNQDRISCVHSGENAENCTIQMNSCLIKGPGEIHTQ